MERVGGKQWFVESTWYGEVKPYYKHPVSITHSATSLGKLEMAMLRACAPQDMQTLLIRNAHSLPHWPLGKDFSPQTSGSEIALSLQLHSCHTFPYFGRIAGIVHLIGKYKFISSRSWLINIYLLWQFCNILSRHNIIKIKDNKNIKISRKLAKYEIES